MTDLTPIIEAAFALVAALITAFLIPYLKKKNGAAKYAEIVEWVKVAVDAAEMIYKGPGRGVEKKAYVLEFLKTKGYTVDAESLNAMIEAAVLAIQGGEEK